MASIQIRPLRDDLPFGSRITGVSEEVLKDEAVRKQINAIFEDRGLIVFEEVEPSSRMHVAISTVFGPLRDHSLKSVTLVDGDTMPGVIEIRHDPATCTRVEIDGKQLIAYLPWHYDACFNNELNRAGVLRALEIPPEGGLTGFADGIQLYNAISPELRKKIEACKILYRNDLILARMRFAKPKNLREIRVQESFVQAYEKAKALPRAIHPAIWTRKSGEKVLHVSPWFALGIEGHENAEGDKLLEAVCQEILAKMNPYFHQWKLTDMVVWDNWRMIHSGSGCDPKYQRRLQRTTIEGDYGLGCFENNGKGDALLEMTV